MFQVDVPVYKGITETLQALMAPKEPQMLGYLKLMWVQLKLAETCILPEKNKKKVHKVFRPFSIWENVCINEWICSKGMLIVPGRIAQHPIWWSLIWWVIIDIIVRGTLIWRVNETLNHNSTLIVAWMSTQGVLVYRLYHGGCHYAQSRQWEMAHLKENILGIILLYDNGCQHEY